ncbi:hypothetical protein [Ruegeria profundi]|uniref:hypothetical protein n=1 Tax=Ruegeria profundi TaxID=1685378 RepID=UPI003C7ACA92
MSIEQKQELELPPSNAQRKNRWADFPNAAKIQNFKVRNSDAGERLVCISGRGTIRVLLALIDGPLYCASPVRISDRVLLLKRDYGLSIRTETYSNDKETDRMRFGVYFLDDNVTPIAANGVAA